MDATLARLRRLVAFDEEALERSLREMNRRSPFVPVTLIDRLEWDDLAAVAVNTPALPGITPDVGLSRHYPMAEDFAHVVGYVGPVSDYDLAKTEDPDPLAADPRVPDRQVGRGSQARAHAPRQGGRAADRGQRGRPGDARARPAGGHRGRRHPADDRPPPSELRPGAAGRRERGGRGDGRPQRRHPRDRLRTRLRSQQVRSRHLVGRLPRADREQVSPAGRQVGPGHLSARLDLQDDDRHCRRSRPA